jgi:uncharacterized membrane protein YoaK (UPF0700 family)
MSPALLTHSKIEKGLSPSQHLPQFPIPNRQSKLWAYLNETVCVDMYLEAQLLLLAFGTGIQDATTYPDYFCFASNQTGNTVLFAIGVAGLAPGAFEFANIGVSLCLFIGGAYIMGQMGNLCNPRRRLWLLFTSFVQTVMVWAAVAIQWTTGQEHQRTGAAPLAVLSLLAFSSSAQVAMARGMKIPEITTAMATAAYVDLSIDPNLYCKHNRGRNRRIIFLFMLAAGSFAGAFANKAYGSGIALMLSAVLKTIALFGLFFNKKVGAEDEE